jgi:3-phenylpropionate/trans-cinnamate dioxygenase ferredoxin subunit
VSDGVTSISQRVCTRDELEPGSSRCFEVEGHKVAVVRCGDDLYAIGDTCSHAEVSLSEGEVLCDEREIECWKHGSTFSLVDGQPQTLPATQPVPVYGVAWDGDDVVVTVPAARGGGDGAGPASRGAGVAR